MADDQPTPDSQDQPPAEKPTEPAKAEAPKPKAAKPGKGRQPESAAPKAAPAAKQSAAPKPAKTDAAPADEAPKADAKPPAPAKPAEAEEVSLTAPPLPEGVHYIWGTGRRKEAVARVRIRPGTGTILVNKRDMEKYFTGPRDRRAVLAPLKTVKMAKSWDVWANVNGGGPTGQAAAVKLGLARALAKAVPDNEAALRDQGLMTRDARMKERKKPGQPGARKRFQYSKR